MNATQDLHSHEQALQLEHAPNRTSPAHTYQYDASHDASQYHPLPAAPPTTISEDHFNGGGGVVVVATQPYTSLDSSNQVNDPRGAFGWHNMAGSGADSMQAGSDWRHIQACALNGVSTNSDGLSGGIRSDAGVNPQLVGDGTYHGAIARIGDLPRDTVPARSLRPLHCG